MLSAGLAKAGVRLIGIYSRPIFEPEFNRLLDEHDSKGSLLSHATLRLAAEVLASLPAGSIHVLCDKHGGRNRYAALLSDAFPGSFIEVRAEGCEQSVYRFGPPKRRVEFRFQAKGESHLPAALASMASKYLRELAMLRIEFLLVPARCRPLGNRRLSAGRQEVQSEIAPVQAELGIDDRSVWRNKQRASSESSSRVERRVGERRAPPQEGRGSMRRPGLPNLEPSSSRLRAFLTAPASQSFSRFAPRKPTFIDLPVLIGTFTRQLTRTP